METTKNEITSTEILENGALASKGGRIEEAIKWYIKGLNLAIEKEIKS